MSYFTQTKIEMPTLKNALVGRDEAIPLNSVHFVNGHSIKPPFPENCEQLVLGMGCFWGAERKFWQLSGVYSTAVGYAQGFTSNPYYEEVCSGMTGHNEVILIVYNPQQIKLAELLTVFWESHDPTHGMRQGNDVGTQYRSGIYPNTQSQLKIADASRCAYQKCLAESGHGKITTEIAMLRCFYYAEEYHQQYLAKNPTGYCGMGGTGVNAFSVLKED